MLKFKEVILNIAIDFVLKELIDMGEGEEIEYMEKALLDSKDYETWDPIIDMYGDRNVVLLEWDVEEAIYYIWLG